ncbi:NDP-sugar synthase [Verrucomicrobiota bacterium]
MTRTIIVLAAGIGSRYGGLKQIEPVGASGEFIIDYSIYDAIRAGFDRAVFVIQRDTEELFRSSIGKRLEKQIPTQYVYQDIPSGRKKPLGTAHAVFTCADIVKGPFAVINADDFYGRNSYDVLARFLEGNREHSLYCMVGFTLYNTLSEHGSVARGVCQADDNNYLVDIQEITDITVDQGRPVCSERNLTGNELVSMNMWGFTPSVFKYLDEELSRFLNACKNDPGKEFFIPAVIQRQITDKQVSVKVLETSASWYGITHPNDKQLVAEKIKNLIDSGQYPESLWK